MHKNTNDHILYAVFTFIWYWLANIGKFLQLNS